MNNVIYNRWVAYHRGNLKNPSTEDLSNFQFIDAAMHTLVPSRFLLDFFGSYENMRKVCSSRFMLCIKVNQLSKLLYDVPLEFIIFKIKYDLKKNLKSNSEEKKKLLGKRKNITYVNFKH